MIATTLPALLQPPTIQRRLHEYCQHGSIRRLALFGSMLRGDDHQSSDVDLLVTYDENARVTLLDMAQQEIDLSTIIGRKVDLRTANDLSRYFRQHVIDEAVTLYERD